MTLLTSEIECAPKGMFRVVDFGEAVRVIVGDYATLPEASDILDQVRYPHTRRIFDDRGRRVEGVRPGK